MSILSMLFRLSPMEKLRSQRKCSKPSDRRFSATRLTCELSMACGAADKGCRASAAHKLGSTTRHSGPAAI